MGQLVTQSTFSLSPTTLKEAMQYADIMAKSTVVPTAYQGKSGNILVAVQMGADLGLKPMQALQNIAVINGRPSIYGDALLALVQVNPVFEDIQETFDASTDTATCTVKRKNQTAHTATYSKVDATTAGLWGKSGPWKNYPKRMLQMRARGFALRDKFADVLGGLITAEEAQDYPVDVTPQAQPQDLSSKLDNVLSQQSQLTNEVVEVSQEEDVNTKQSELSQLILQHSVSSNITNAWCKKAEVDNIYDLQDKLNDEQLLACMDYINRNCVEDVKEAV